jgi:hypothetical protein
MSERADSDSQKDKREEEKDLCLKLDGASDYCRAETAAAIARDS